MKMNLQKTLANILHDVAMKKFSDVMLVGLMLESMTELEARGWDMTDVKKAFHITKRRDHSDIPKEAKNREDA